MKRYLQKRGIILSIVFCILISTEAYAENTSKILVLKNFKYHKIEKYDVELECVSPKREFEAGSKVKMTFRLRNYAMEPLIIYEWYSKEKNNIRLYYVPWKPGMKIPPKDQWTAVIPKIEKNPKHMTMELSYRSSALLDVDLSFIEKLKTDHIQYFYIFTELNLTSIFARSKFIKIMVKP